MKSSWPIVTIIVAGLLATGCLEGREVVQGTVVRFEKTSNTLVVKDELPPNGEVVFSTKGAEFGAAFSEGDLLRVAYKEVLGMKVATRIMRVEAQ